MSGLTRAQVHEMDRRAAGELGLPGLVLMENAGRGVAEQVMGLLHARSIRSGQRARVAVVCGGGNNGGDGFVTARHLLCAEVVVTLWTLGPLDQLRGDAAVMAEAARRLSIPIRVLDDPGGRVWASALEEWGRSDVIVDALLGVGYRPPMRARTAAVIEAINGSGWSGASVVSVDVPSGLEGDSGRASEGDDGRTIRADLTVTMLAPKVGLLEERAAGYVGRVVTASIGVPRAWAVPGGLQGGGVQG